MKSTAVRLGCMLSVLLVAGSAGAASNAMTISGNSFNDFFAPGCVSRFNGGISNACSGDTNFSYGIPKGPSTVGGYTVTFAGNNSNTSVTSSCTVFSHSSSGNFLFFLTSNASGVSGNWTRNVALTAAQAPTSGRLTAIVGLPGNFLGSLFGLSLAY